MPHVNNVSQQKLIKSIFSLKYMHLKVTVFATVLLCIFMSQTRDQKRFTISEVAADWHELMITQGDKYAAIHCPRQRTIGPAVCSQPEFSTRQTNRCNSKLRCLQTNRHGATRLSHHNIGWRTNYKSAAFDVSCVLALNLQDQRMTDGPRNNNN